MEIAVYIVSMLLWVWFFGCIISYKIGQKVLVEGMGFKSYEFIMLLLLTTGIAANFIYKDFGSWLLLGVLCFWIIIQFFCHWYYTIFGASNNKIQGYNSCFANTIHIFPLRNDRLIPDLYHISLHLLILLDIIFITYKIYIN